MEVEIAGGEGGIANHLDVGGDAEAFEARADGGGVRWMKDYAGEFAGVDALQGGLGDAGDGFGVGGEFAVEDAAGDGEGEGDEVAFGLSAKRVAFEGLFGDGAGELLIDGALLGLESFADTAVALAESFVAGLRGLGAQGEFEFRDLVLELFELGGVAGRGGGRSAGSAGADRLDIKDDRAGVALLPKRTQFMDSTRGASSGSVILHNILFAHGSLETQHAFAFELADGADDLLLGGLDVFDLDWAERLHVFSQHLRTTSRIPSRKWSLSWSLVPFRRPSAPCGRCGQESP